MKEMDLYFIAIVPDDPVNSEIQKIKEDASLRYNTKAALKSPPHITLYMPFRYKSEKIERLKKALEEVSLDHKPFTISLKDFGCFEPRVLFIGVQESDDLSKLRKEVILKFKKELKLLDKGFEERPFHPHVTIAFRDLKKTDFWKAWNEEFKEKEFDQSFTANTISLLKHNGKQWEEHEKFPLKG